MCQHDKAVHREQNITNLRKTVPFKKSTEVHDIGTPYLTKEDANASLQQSDPDNYGPYLEEGECYKEPRTTANVDEKSSP